MPLFLLPIYRAAEARYGVPWQVLAAINEIESDFGRNARVSSAGAVGWMQFMPPTWRRYGVDRNRDGKRDPYNPIDATFAAARYLSAAGAPGDLRSALFAYNHADWYVKDVLSRARRIERTTSPLLDALTGLAYARFPVPTPAAWRPMGGGRRRGVAIHTAPGSPVLAVNDGVIVGMGRSRSLGRYIVLEDLQGNRFTYARLGWVAERHGVIADTRPNGRESVDPRKVRLFAHPARRRALAAGGLEQLIESGAPVPGYASFDKGRHGMGRHASKMRPLRIGSRVAAGTVLGRVGGARPNGMGRIRFEIRPVGPGAPLIDPEAVLDAWQRLDAAGAFRPSGASTLGGMQGGPSLRPALMVPLRLLQRKVLADPRITIYPCGRADVAAGRIDRRVLVTLEFLAASNLRPTVTSLECGHGRLTASGNVSEHTSGDAVDIASINGIPILGHQGTNSITDVTVRRLLTLKGAMEPHQIISLMTFKGSDNTLAMSDHANHIHVGFRPRRHPAAPTPDAFAPELSRRDWVKLSAQLASIPNPAVPVPATLRRVAHTKRPGR